MYTFIFLNTIPIDPPALIESNSASYSRGLTYTFSSLLPSKQSWQVAFIYFFCHRAKKVSISIIGIA